MFDFLIEKAIVFLPLIAAIITGFADKRLGDRNAQLLTSGTMVLAALLSVWLFVQVGLNHKDAYVVPLFTWFASGDFAASWALRIDTLTAVMLVVVTVVSSIVHIYSAGYMADDKSIPRFQAYLSLFTFAMLMLVTADNLIQLFFGWEGVGLSSYLLIGFWYHKPSANAAAMKAFIVNRVGDFGFALGIFGAFLLTGSVAFSGETGVLEIARHVDADNPLPGILGMSFDTSIIVVTALLFMGAMGKSAQFLLHTWLPDAMEGPTPVSALIHAATMVTAGVFMVVRLSPLFELAPLVLDFVTVIGALTAIFAATVGLTQFDIKRVIAYSTCSQLGYMFFAAGVGAYDAAVFHLMTHAFFKALLFLGAGSVIHAMHHEQDMRKMGGIWRKVPVTYAYMWIGSLALAGIGIPFLFGPAGFGFAGFYSKDAILEAAHAAHTLTGNFAFWAGITAAFLTAFYSGRLIFLTFHGETRADKHTFDHAHESPLVMVGPLVILAIGAVLAGGVAYPWFMEGGHHGYGDAGKHMKQATDGATFWAGSVVKDHDLIDKMHASAAWVKILPLVMAVSGLGLSAIFYLLMPNVPKQIAKTFAPIDIFFRRKWFFDEIYDFLFVRPIQSFGRFLWKAGDGSIIDRFGPNGVAGASQLLARFFSSMQTGYIYHYGFVMVAGLVAIITLFLFGSGFAGQLLSGGN
jgi:NADH-quinone oxidoreductase subunit L